MIAKINGNLDEINVNSVIVELSGIYFEIFMTPYSISRLKDTHKIGDKLYLITKLYIEAGIAGSNFIPKLLGFLEKEDSEFFDIFTTVKGLGEKKALKSMVISVAELAVAIESSDLAGLKNLPGFGGRMADKIVAELKGKVTRFASADGEKFDKVKPDSGFENEAMVILIEQLGFRRVEAETMLRSALIKNSDFKSVEDLIQTIFIHKTVRD